MKSRKPIGTNILFFFITVFLVLMLPGNIHASTNNNVDGKLIYYEFFDGHKNIKIASYLFLPAKGVSDKIVFLFHGGVDGAEFGFIQKMGKFLSEEGLIAVAVSRPGYGKSEGVQDFCGPVSLQAMNLAIDFYKEYFSSKKLKVGIYGVSAGSIIVPFLLSMRDDISFGISDRGVYDLYYIYKKTKIVGLKKKLEKQVGLSKEEFDKRSSIYIADKIRTPILIFHGKKDKRAPIVQARKMVRKLRKSGKSVRAIFESKYNHKNVPTPEKLWNMYFKDFAFENF